MPVAAIRNMVQGGGVNRDQSPDDLSPNAWSNIINGRFSRNRIERFGGDELYQNATTTPSVANARVIEDIVRNGSEGFVLITDSQIFLDIGAGYQDFSPVVTIQDSEDWILTQYGDWIILTVIEGVQEPLVLGPLDSQFRPFTNWRAGFQVTKIFPYKNFLIAIGVEENNNPQNGLVFWSDVVNEDILADVAWDPADPTTLAGENVLPSADGLIRDGGVLRDSGILYTDTSVWRMDVGNATAGAFPLVFNFRLIFNDDGILRTRCFTEVNGRHYVVGLYDIYVHDGFNKQSISDNRMTEFFFESLGTGNFAFVAHYQRPQEIIISYSTGTNQAANAAIVYNYFYDTFTTLEASPLTTGYTRLILGVEFVQDVLTWEDAQTMGLTWAQVNSITWNSLFPQSRERIPIVLVPGRSELFFIDRNTNSSTAVDLFIERRDLDLDSFFEDSNNTVIHLKRFVPQVTGDGLITIQFGGRNVLGQPIIWDPERTYDLLTNFKFDMRVSYRYPAIRIQQGQDGNAFRMTGYDLVARSVGRR